MTRRQHQVEHLHDQRAAADQEAHLAALPEDQVVRVALRVAQEEVAEDHDVREVANLQGNLASASSQNLTRSRSMSAA